VNLIAGTHTTLHAAPFNTKRATSHIHAMGEIKAKKSDHEKAVK
jgi:hypothetical protein